MPRAAKTHLQLLREKQPKPTRRTSKDRGYGSIWQRVRLMALRRDCYLCQNPECGKPVGKSGHVHHLDGDSRNNDLDNLQTLCQSCHSKETKGFTHGQ